MIQTTTTDPSVFVFTTTDYSTLTLYTTLFSGDETIVISSEHIVPDVITATITPTSTTSSSSQLSEASILTFLTTFTYYTTYFSGSEPVIASSESVVTQYITIDSAPTISSASHTETLFSSPIEETIIGIATVSGGDISSSFNKDTINEQIIGISSIVVTETEKQSTDDLKTDIDLGPTNENQAESISTIEPSDVIMVQPSPLMNIPSVVYVSEKESESSLIEDGDTLISTGISASIKEGSTVIFFSDVVLPSQQTPDLPITSSSIVSETTEIIGLDGKIKTLAPNATLMVVTGTDGFVTKYPELSPEPSFDMSKISSVVSSSISSAIKPATVIELSDLLGGNTALGGDIGLAIQDIVSLITGKKNKTDTDNLADNILAENVTELSKTYKSIIDSSLSSDTINKITTRTIAPSEKTDKFAIESKATTVSISDEMLTSDIKASSKYTDHPVFVLSTVPMLNKSEINYPAPIYVPDKKKESPGVEYKILKEKPISSSSSSIPSEIISTSVITGARTVFILPSKITPSKSYTSDSSSSIKNNLESSKNIFESDKSSVKTSTPAGSTETSTVFSDLASTEPGSMWKRPEGPKHSHQLTTESSPAETVIARANVPTLLPSSKPFTTITKSGQTIISRTTTGATTIFFPDQLPKVHAVTIPTRYITSVESITRTLALTTTRTYYTRDSTLVVPSVYTTTIPPRTFVSTIIGKRTILGILPEPSETVQIYKSSKPSERTTTITTTTLIFNSIPSTVVRTLVLPTIEPTKHSNTGIESLSTTLPDDSIFNVGTEKPAEPPEAADSTSMSNAHQPNDLTSKNFDEHVKQKTRNETYLRAADPRISEFQPDNRIKEADIRRPPIVISSTSVRPEEDPFLNGRNGVCDPKCQPFKKEVCSEKDGFWKCQCRPGHARKNDYEICKEIHTYVLLLKVMKMGNTSINYETSMADQKSKEFQEFSKAVEDGISDVYYYSNVRDHFLGAEVSDLTPVNSDNSESYLTSTPTSEDPNQGVVVNFTVQVSKSVSPQLLEQELVRSLQLSDRRLADSFLLAAPLTQSIRDFNECSDIKFNDCSLRANCENLEGSYTCKCDEKYEDADSKLPGRTCLEKTVNCEYCHSRGDCLENDDKQIFCRCLSMYVGKRCEINGLVLAVALPTAVAVVVILLCIVLCCCRKCRKKGPKGHSSGGDPSAGVFKGIALKGPVGGTLDRKAMIDTSSESSGEHARRSYHPFDTYQESGDITPVKDSKRSDLSLNRSLSTGYAVPPVLIPRARSQTGGSSSNGKPVNYTVYNGQVYVW